MNMENKNNNHIDELKNLKNKYNELEKYLDDMMKEKKEIAKNENLKRNKQNELINENKKLKNIINNLNKN